MHTPRFFPILYFSFTAVVALAQPQKRDPSFEEVISLRDPGSPEISPDGRHVAFTVGTADWKNNRFDTEIWLSKDGGTPFQLTRTAEGSSNATQWSPDGQWLAFPAKRGEHTQVHVIRVAGGEAWPVTRVDRNIGSIRWPPDGRRIAYLGSDGMTLQEVFISTVDNIQPEKLTNFTAQIANWKTAQSEVISWKSQDGTTIEGVLHKPQDYDPSKKYPLLVRIHGGPAGVDRPTPVPASVYPAVQWLNKGALILRVNYRGSAGYGEAFRSLNVRNLGVGDAWDVLSGVDHLAAQRLIDTTRIGCMGWSQGGYISAFLTTTSNRFKAISVGAGISDWVTYYVNTDIHPFTRQYLKATPWEDKAIYDKTSPMTYINQATTPTLIQHGENDQRVPIPNAYKLYQGLQDQGVPTELIVYKGFGHGITRPKERLAAMWHNWQWFNKYLWEEMMELPVGDEE